MSASPHDVMRLIKWLVIAVLALLLIGSMVAKSLA